MRDCGYRDRPWHGSRPCDDTCQGAAYFRVIWTWGPAQRGEIKVESAEEAWQVARDHLAKGYSVVFSLALVEHVKAMAAS